MITNPNDWTLEEAVRQVLQALRNNPLLAGAIGSGGLRFYDAGRARFEGGGGVEIADDGFIKIDGDIDGEGRFDWSGRWRFDSGDGEIAGNVTLAGLFALLGDLDVREDGKITVGGVVLEPLGGGRVRVGDDVVIDAANGGRITIGDDILIEAAEGGRIVVGGMTLDPHKDGGAVDFGDGRVINAAGGYMAIYNGDDQFVIFQPTSLVLYANGTTIRIGEDGMRVTGLPAHDTGDAVSYVSVDGSGLWGLTSAATGGPGGSGQFQWPFPLTVVSREYGPGYDEYDDGIHKGIDFSGGPAVLGAPIGASGAGTVAGTGYDGERGNWIILDHGARDGRAVTSRYYHLQAASLLPVGATVTKGQTVGYVGSTGMSTGAHLHLEFRLDGEHINPRTFMTLYGE